MLLLAESGVSRAGDSPQLACESWEGAGMLMILTRVRGVDIHRFGTCYAYWVDLGKRAVRVSSIEGLCGESCGPVLLGF